MRTRRTRWTVVLALAAMMGANLGCSGRLTRELRDALFAGLGSFVQNTTLDLLNQTIDLTGQQ